MIYFDNAATGGKKPEAVLVAANAAIRLCANPGRSSHRLSLACANEILSCRKLLAEHFDCDSFENVVFTKNCTEALNIAIFGALNQGDHVVTTCMEHNSVLRPLHQLAKQGYLSYDICPLRGGNISPKELASFVKPSTKAVIVTTASNVTGATPDLLAIKKLLPENVLLICDGAQGGGHLPLKMRQAGIDILCLAGHKGLLGIQGSGALLFSSRVSLRPLLFGGTGSLSYTLDMPDFSPDSLEAGTLNYPAIAALKAGVAYLSLHEREIGEKLRRLTALTVRGLKRFRGVRVYSEPNPCGIVAMSHENKQSEYLALLLSQKYDIATRGGLHCAPLMHEALGTADEGLLRISFSHENTEKEVDALLASLQEIFSL
ncbi:MAG: aminotransferase class V-fold PLP-dependent enzyme [Clostridia bacterium]|nr:aminotransferase class V-fold PLP-dependent enzyme [Clostridia bacterium]